MVEERKGHQLVKIGFQVENGRQRLGKNSQGVRCTSTLEGFVPSNYSGMLYLGNFKLFPSNRTSSDFEVSYVVILLLGLITSVPPLTGQSFSRESRCG